MVYLYLYKFDVDFGRKDNHRDEIQDDYSKYFCEKWPEERIKNFVLKTFNLIKKI